MILGEHIRNNVAELVEKIRDGVRAESNRRTNVSTKLKVSGIIGNTNEAVLQFEFQYRYTL